MGFISRYAVWDITGYPNAHAHTFQSAKHGSPGFPRCFLRGQPQRIMHYLHPTMESRHSLMVICEASMSPLETNKQGVGGGWVGGN